jgi:hypothetical protein
MCSHGEKCPQGKECTVGMRRNTEALITGAVLPVWKFIEEVRKGREDMRVVRCTTDDGQTFVGLHVESESALSRIVGAVEALDAGAYMSDDEAGGAGGFEDEEEEDEM